ncbi:hypothetical protein VNO77_05494 [Canavalia gladiata]|uniref:Uncharacterized protein n=1 Tax=Canavalia gladiata TaxID=3824 RepID=A0AAN9N456_CANGL
MCNILWQSRTQTHAFRLNDVVQFIMRCSLPFFGCFALLDSFLSFASPSASIGLLYWRFNSQFVSIQFSSLRLKVSDCPI